MKRIFVQILLVFFGFTLTLPVSAQEAGNIGVKTTTDITVDDLGNATVTLARKFNAMYWDNFLRYIGTNSSILKNEIENSFPQEVVTNFKYTPDNDNRSYVMEFTVLGMAKVNKNGRWAVELDRKNPDMTKISDKDWLFMQDGNPLKIHLPDGTDDTKLEKDSFGNAILTFPASESGSGMGKILLFAGIALALGGAFLLYKKMSQPQKLRTIYEPVTHHEEIRDMHPVQPKTVPPVPGRVSGPSVIPDEFPAEKPPVYNRDAEL